MNKLTWIRTLLLNFDSIIDSHSFKEDVFENWNLLQPLFFKLFGSKFKRLFDMYYLEYTDIMKP